MLGRTHGQPGPADHVRLQGRAVGGGGPAPPRADRRRREPRLAVGQLAGAVGTLSAWGEQGPELQRRLMERLGLGVPDTSWLTARDRIAEFITLLALITGTLAKIGNEVYNLQRPELGELSEAPSEGVVGSITMPQKRNPERSEHLSTLARIVRANAGLALEGLVGEHERDGAPWKTEWQSLPQASAAAATSLAFARELVEGLRVDAARMRANLDAQRGYVLAEPAMLALSAEGRQAPRARADPPRRARRPGAGDHAAGGARGRPGDRGGAPDVELRPEQALGAVHATIDAVLKR